LLLSTGEVTVFPYGSGRNRKNNDNEIDKNKIENSRIEESNKVKNDQKDKLNQSNDSKPISEHQN
jgi:hypothetical protein